MNYSHIWMFLLSCWGLLQTDANKNRGATDFRNKREGDYITDNVWNEENPIGEAERLIKEYPENKELLKNSDRYYQIVYPVQIRHHEKVGISTREVPATKRDETSRQYYSDKPNKHFKRTSYLVKAFSHKFRLELELNTHIIAPNLYQNHILPGGAGQVSKQEIEQCYYHGIIKDIPGAVAAVTTCSGLSGVIHVGNETLIIHPFYGGDLSKKHPHVIFEAKSNIRQECATRTRYSWPSMMPSQRTYNRHSRDILELHVNGTNTDHLVSQLEQERLKLEANNRSKRSHIDVREAIKYIKVALILDREMFAKRNGSTRAQVIQDALQITNIADLYFKSLNTRISVVYIETWESENRANLDSMIGLKGFLDVMDMYNSKTLYKIEKDTTQVLTGEIFRSGESGMSSVSTICTGKALGITSDLNVYEPHLTASTLAHMIGHNAGMGHDDRDDCSCNDWHGCIMAKSIVGAQNVQPYKFSSCSTEDYFNNLQLGRSICLLNKPKQTGNLESCGNGIVENGEDCDCGKAVTCNKINPCCDAITCRLKEDAQCAGGPCCHNCKLRPPGYPCRRKVSECDIPEFCDGNSGKCPDDIFRKNGIKCHHGEAFCYNGQCNSRKLQCERIWDYGGIPADRQCYEQFNQQGSLHGHCGRDKNNNYIKCSAKNVMCGALQCQMGSQTPKIGEKNHNISRSLVTIGGKDFECKTLTGQKEDNNLGLVLDGTVCGKDLICINQTCTSVYPFIQTNKCSSNNIALECSGHGVCSNINTCHCDSGWTGTNCAIKTNISTPPPMRHITSPTPSVTEGPTPQVPDNNWQENWQKNTTKTYAVDHGTANTVYLVIILVSVVGGVFLVFALLALCYRRKTTMPKYDPPYPKKPMLKKNAPTKLQPKEEESSFDSVNRMISFGSMPSYSSAGSNGREHKMQHFIRQGYGGLSPSHTGSCSEEEALQSGEDENLSFIDLPCNNLSKLPEKGILKRQHFECPSPELKHEKEKWSEGSQSDNQDLLFQIDESLDLDTNSSDLERQYRGLNGYGMMFEQDYEENFLDSMRYLDYYDRYHEDILQALRSATSHRGGAVGSGGSASLSDDFRKSFSDGYPEYNTEFTLLKGSHDKLLGTPGGMGDSGGEEDPIPPCGPIRIRNLEDLIRQLEHHPGRHMSPSGSEEIRMSETEADRHYRLDSSSCTESQGVGRSEDGLGGFVYGRYRQPSSSTLGERLGITPSLSPMGIRIREPSLQGSHRALAAALAREARDSLPLSSDGADSQGITEYSEGNRDMGDSESDDFLQHQHLVRSASDEAMSVGRKRDYYDRSAKRDKQSPRGSRSYIPSPHSEDSYPGSNEDNGSVPGFSVSGESRDSRDAEARPVCGSRYPEYKH